MADPTLSKKRYVLLADAGRISGYTNEYVERLCRIGKIPCRSMGEKTIVELESLLSQTGTILLGSEHVASIEVSGDAYPAYPVDVKTETAPEVRAESTLLRAGRIAVVGDVVHDEQHDQPSDVREAPQAEKFPSNALPFFSSMGKIGGKTGIHIAVQSASVPSAMPSAQGAPASSVIEKKPLHVMITKEGEPARPSSVKNITVMPAALPVGFTPIVPMPIPATPLPAAPAPLAIQSVPSSVSGGAAPLHDHDLDRYSSKLPMLLPPTSLAQRGAIGLIVIGLLVLPTALGIGGALDELIKGFSGSLHSGGRTMMAAVGMINPDRDSTRFPHLVETSRLLSAVGATGSTGSQTGIVVTPSTGSSTTDAQIKDVIQKTFSTPVDVVPDWKGARTGLIKPTFQKSSTNYIYVMVPFRN